MSAWTVVGLLLAGALIAIVFVGLGVIVAIHFGDVAYKRYQQGITDGWKAHGVRNEMNAMKRTAR